MECWHNERLINEVVEVMSRHKVDICGLQELRWRGASVRLVEGKDSRYKLFWVGNDKDMGGVIILLAEKWVEAIFDVKLVSDRIMLIKLVVGKSIVTVLLVYAPQTGLDDSAKDQFYENVQWTSTKINATEILFVCGDFIGHTGKNANRYEEFIVVEDLEDVIWRVREFLNLLFAHKLVVSNSLFRKKRESSGNISVW